MRKGFKKLFALVMVVAMATTGTAQVKIEKDPARNTWVAGYEKDSGRAQVRIIKDPTDELVKAGRQKDLPWTELTELGRSPWCKTPAKSMEELSKNPEIREYLKTKTTLNAAQQAALNKAMNNPAQWMTVKAHELPILESFWGNNWQRYKVAMNLSEKYANTDVFLYFSAEMNEWYAFYAYCCNLGQPFQAYTWKESVQEVQPKVVVPRCLSLRTKGWVREGRRTYEVEMFNPNGVDVILKFLLKEPGEPQRVLASGVGEVTFLAEKPGTYKLSVEGLYNNKPIDTAACSAEFAVQEPPLPSISMQPPPAPEETPKKAGSKKKWVWVGVAAGAGAAAIVLATQGGGKGVKIPGRPANIP